jgi:hypothetical protein
MSDRIDKLFAVLSVTAAVVFRFVIPALLCVALIVAAIADYDRRFPNPPDHFTPARAIATIAILSVTLLWLAWRFMRFARRHSSSPAGVMAEQRDAADSR